MELSLHRRGSNVKVSAGAKYARRAGVCVDLASALHFEGRCPANLSRWKWEKKKKSQENGNGIGEATAPFFFFSTILLRHKDVVPQPAHLGELQPGDGGVFVGAQHERPSSPELILPGFLIRRHRRWSWSAV